MIIRFAVTLTAILMSLNALGLTGQEREALFHIHQELSALDQWITQAEQSIDSSNPYTLDYQQLRKDIANIREGISDATKKVHREPRTLPPIEGGY